MTDMARKGTKKQEPKIGFQISKKAIDAPRRVRLASGKWVGLGGDIHINPEPPKKPYVIPAAKDQAELLELCERFPKYIRKVAVTD